MFKKIMVPIDLEHLNGLSKALDCAADLARRHAASLCYVGVTMSGPTSVAHTPDEFAAKLKAFADSKGAQSRVYESHDPTADLDEVLLRAAEDLGADLVVMASHIPGALEHVFASNAGAVASHAKVSVFVIR